MTRVAILGDTHMPKGARALPKACVSELRTADAVIHTGDFWSGPFHDELSALCGGLIAVHGNVDDFELEAKLPEARQVEIDGVRLGLIHDSGTARGRLARMRDRFPGADAVIFGHSHIPVHEVHDGLQLFNPGSPTERRRAPARTMGVAEIAGGEIEFRHITLS